MKRLANLPFLFIFTISLMAIPGLFAEESSSGQADSNKETTVPTKKLSRRAEYVKRYKESYNPKNYAERYKEAYKSENYKQLYSRSGGRLLIPSLEELEKMNEARETNSVSEPSNVQDEGSGIGWYSWRSRSRSNNQRNNNSKSESKSEVKDVQAESVVNPAETVAQEQPVETPESNEKTAIKPLLPDEQDQNNQFYNPNPYARYLYAQPQINRVRLRNASDDSLTMPGSNDLLDLTKTRPDSEVQDVDDQTVLTNRQNGALPPGASPMDRGNGGTNQNVNDPSAETSNDDANSSLYQLLAKKGDEAFAKRDYRKANQNYARLAALQPDNAEVQIAYGMTLLGIGDYEKSATTLQKGVDLANSQNLTISSYESFFTSTKDYQFNLSKLDRFIKRNPENEPAKELLLLLSSQDNQKTQPQPETK